MDKFKKFFKTSAEKTGGFFKSLFVSTDESEAKLLTFYKKDGTKSVISSILCILAGIFVGFIVMLIIAAASEDITIGDAFYGLGIIFAGPFASGTSQYVVTNLGDMIFYSVPLILCGLSVAIAFKTGLFNIGASGQFLMGTMGSLLVALNIPASNSASGFFIWMFAIIVGAAFGFCWGALPGLFKALFNVNEVIVCIMTNWIAANIVTWVFSEMPALVNSGSGKSGYLITTATTGTGTPKIGLDKLFPGSYIDFGIIIAIVLAVVVLIVLNRTTFGYELKACGNNKYSAKYAGMNEKRNIVISMAIAGALAGIAGSLYYLNPGIEFNFSAAYSKLPDYGFNGIPVALLASNNPIGVIFAGLFMRYIAQGGDNLTSANYNRYIADIIIALIIYFAGFSKLIRDFLSRRRKVKEKQAVESAVKEESKKERNFLGKIEDFFNAILDKMKIKTKKTAVPKPEAQESVAESVVETVKEETDSSPVNTDKKEV